MLQKTFMKWSYKRYFLTDKYYYTDVNNCPVAVWFNGLESKEIYLYSKSKRVDLFFPSLKFLAFEMCYDSYIKKFGLPTSFLNSLRVKKKVMELQSRYLKTRDRRLLTKIQVLQEQSKEEIQEFKKDLTRDLIVIGQFLHQNINPNTFTVDEYYTTLQLIEQDRHGKKN